METMKEDNKMNISRRGSCRFPERRNCRIWKRICARLNFPSLRKSGENWKIRWLPFRLWEIVTTPNSKNRSDTKIGKNGSSIRNLSNDESAKRSYLCSRLL